MYQRSNFSKAAQTAKLLRKLARVKAEEWGPAARDMAREHVRPTRPEARVLKAKSGKMSVFIGGAELGESKGGNPDLERWARRVGGIYISELGGADAIARGIRAAKAENPDLIISLVGYSRGGEKAIAIANALGRGAIPVRVDHLVLLDTHRIMPGVHSVIGRNVREAVNFYQENPRKMPYNTFRGRAVRGARNVDLTGIRAAQHSYIPHLVFSDPALKAILPDAVV